MRNAKRTKTRAMGQAKEDTENNTGKREKEKIAENTIYGALYTN